MANSDFAVNTYSYTLDYTAEECLTELTELGFTDFELMMYPGHAWPNDMDASARRALKQHIQAVGANVNSLNTPNLDINLVAATEEMRRYSFDVVRSYVELAGNLGVPNVVIGPGKVNPLLPAPRERVLHLFHEVMERLIKLARTNGTRLLAENMPMAFLSDCESLRRAIDDYAQKDVGMVYDVANAAFIKESPEEGLRWMRDRLDIVHVSDTTTAVYKHDPVGDGDIDFAAVGKALRDAGWTGKPVLEVITQASSPSDVIVDSARALERAGWNELAAA